MAARASLKFITVPATSRHTATVIFVHGLGDTGAGWEPVANMFRQDPGLKHVKWVLPHAPIQPVTANMGMEMPSWFDIYSFGFDSTEDEKGMLEAATQLNVLIDAEVKAGIPESNIILGGFSQGGCMSLLTGLTREVGGLGGLAILSGWLPLKDKITSMISSHATSTPIFWGHGTIDPLVKYKSGQASVAFLTSQLSIPEGEKGLTFKTYEGVGHSTNHKELNDLRAWITKTLPKSE